ncbi:Flp pilus assembly protein TadG [Limimaricola variabilis]|uniref:Flp pilus assembly protein TadG n=1 Tax=Limimaricola variabilis TaxID=1492771 RepID=A0ABR6HTI5_9RHOB|nr:Flp pilus assembly protein TadG [Limimaricola variabilis]
MLQILNALTSSKDDEGGNVTIEFVLWVPLVAFLLLLTVDVGQIFLKQAQATRLVQDANRALSVGKIRTTVATETFIKDRLAGFSTAVTAQTTYDPGTGIISTTAKIPLRDLTVTQALPIGQGATVTIQSSHMMEF